MRYFIFDVFSERPLAGNPLAVVVDADVLEPARMQALAREFNLSETSFLLAPADPAGGAHARARFFTPVAELPMAGHPTVGTAFALERLGRLPRRELLLELGVGPVTVTLERDADGRLQRAWMDQGRPRFLSGPLTGRARARVAAAMALAEDELASELPLQLVSAGVPFVLAPLRDLEALQRARPASPEALRAVHEELPPGAASRPPGLLAFALAPAATAAGEQAGPRVRARMFGASLGIAEDPATGSAHGPLGAFLALHGALSGAAREVDEAAGGGSVGAGGPGGVEFISHQGVEMGRPSELFVRVRPDGDGWRVTVGGGAALVAEGELKL